MAQQDEKHQDEEDQPEMTDGYKVAEKVGVADLMDKDKDDKALQKYKEQLLGKVENSIIDASDKRQVFFDALVIEVIEPKGRDPIVLDPSKCSSNEVAFTLKEKAKYRVVIKFRVQREIVLGLKKFEVIKRKGILCISLRVFAL